MLIAHCLSTVEKAELVVVLAEGRIVERGSHTALLAPGGVMPAFGGTLRVVMTEKDAVKCRSFAAPDWLALRVAALLPDTLLEAVRACIDHHPARTGQ